MDHRREDERRDLEQREREAYDLRPEELEAQELIELPERELMTLVRLGPTHVHGPFHIKF